MDNKDNHFGICTCGTAFMAEWFREKEYTPTGIPTGRTRRNINVLFCPCCGKTEPCDDSFAGAWVIDR